MNQSTVIETGLTSQPELIAKLCKHLAENNQTLCKRLNKVAFNYLALLSSTNTEGPHDEQCVIAQIKQILASKSQESVESFELHLSNIKKTTIFRNRASVLRLLQSLSKNPVNNDLKWGENLETFPIITQMIRTSDSQESIKNIYVKRSLQSSSSSNLRHGSQISMSSINASTKNNLDSTSRSSVFSLITEQDLLQDVIYSFQGIEGKYLRKEAGGLGFVIDTKFSKTLTPIQQGLVERLIGISFLHNQLKQFCENYDKQGGNICQALVATLREELSSYYKTIALLQASVKKQIALDQSDMTLRKALVYVDEHRIRFEWLAYIAEQCYDKKGGALITAVHGFLQHGSKCAQEVAKRVLTAVCKPLYIMLSRWLLDGEMNDPSNEFFIEVRNISSMDKLWHDKYCVRKSMVPSFITMDQAKKILATGKSINFLRQICKDTDQLPGRDSLQKLFKFTSPEALFAPEESLEFHSILEKVYRETSARVLDLLRNKYRLLEHLQSLRRYLLLGQGDFIRHLLELLAPELNKQACDIYAHTLTTILESAIRVTNAQYEDEDTLQRLTVSFMGYSVGDTGWDVFSLVYIVDGPISTIFQSTMVTYQCLFGALWKAKRMEFVLANMRKQQISISKMFRKIQELKSVMHIIHILTSKMIHFLHQTQYYFLFEVLECSWAEMLKQVTHAECLDDIISAHSTFLNSVKCGVLLDETSKALFSQLITIYNFILNLESYQDCLYAASLKEYNAFNELRNKIEKSQSSFGLSRDEELLAKERRFNFHQFLKEIKIKINSLAEAYDQFVKNYLKLLSSSSNMNLQLLSVRLSFNDFYKVT